MTESSTKSELASPIETFPLEIIPAPRNLEQVRGSGIVLSGTQANYNDLYWGPASDKLFNPRHFLCTVIYGTTKRQLKFETSPIMI